MPEKLVVGPNTGRVNTLLVNSPSRLYTDGRYPGERELTPYGLGLVATDASRHPELSVGVLDAEFLGLSVPKILDAIDDATGREPGVLGMNVLTPTFVPTMQLARMITEHNPQLRMVFGGPHATLDPKSILQHMPESVVIQGHGERTFANLAMGVPPEEITGAVFKDTSGNIVRGGRGVPNVVFDLKEQSWMNRTFLQNEPFDKNGLSTMTFLGSRGCRGSCTFCITPAQYEVMRTGGSKKLQFRDMEDLIAEVADARRSNGIQLAQFIDDDLLPNRSRAEEFHSRWNEAGLAGKMEFIALLRPDKIGEFDEYGLMRDLRDAGLRKISIGIETGHDRGRRMLSGSRRDGIDPKYDPSHVRTAVKVLDSLDIETKGFFMLGFPGETRAEIVQTLQYMYDLREIGLDRVALFPVKVYPATGLWNTALQMGFTPEQLGHYDAPNIKELIQNGHNAKDATRDGYTGVQLSEVPPDELNALCQEHMGIFNSGQVAPRNIMSI